ncbi:hypothetical protein GMPD_00060 [Geomonas paludis]|uniref:Peptidase C51 domain-containing protein n=1 Tax=Geomonas paludis TaxID=2740185 RepID=A0A6V8MQK2_9BACT|nr:hypothetical protein GMPD_00060 [Geomonas paludis]
MAHALGDTPGPLGLNDGGAPNKDKKTSKTCLISAAKGWDRLAAAAYLVDPINGWAGKRSKGRCARAIRLAINAGRIPTPNNPVSAADYKSYLPKLGFSPVDIESYAPRIGDIAVFPADVSSGHVHGHIEMFTGNGWQSDFVQEGRDRDGKYGRGFFAHQIWTSKPFIIFRMKGAK